jgi:mono/diheme cytochrome c family protein
VTFRIAPFRAALAAICVFAPLRTGAQNPGGPPNTGMADPAALGPAYDRYVAANPNSMLLTIPVVSLRGISSEPFNAGGNVRIDYGSNSVVANVRGLPADDAFDLWIVDNRTPGTTLVEAVDLAVKVGSFVWQGARHTLTAPLAVPIGFFPDRAFVVRSGQTPMTFFVLTGAPNFFERLRRRQVKNIDPVAPTRISELAAIVAEGRRLFLKETFAGNGRTCGTCHVETNNFTIDPDFIATLPRTEPLFVAETNPALTNLENSDLLRRFGLFLVNADGFEPHRGFVLRSAQNVQALGNSTTPQDPSFGIDFSTNGRNPNPPERLGWGNDGAPLRDFAFVAIVQHAPRTLGRRLGVDFRIPTDDELDALVAYQLGLGRQEDFNLQSLELNSGIARNGKALYLDTGDIFQPGHKNCNACHFNGGGTAGMSFNPGTPGFPRGDGSPRGFNIGAATGVNEIPLALSLRLPRDGGFGQLPTIFGSFGNTDDLPPPFGHFELEEFNTPPLVESADTAPFFHNHTVKDLESAIAFYGTPAFQLSIGNGGIPVNISADPNHPEVQAIGAFLRVLNALENIRSSIALAARGRTMAAAPDAHDLANLALAETTDAIEVLSAGALAGSTEPGILAARGNLLAARALLDPVRGVPSLSAIGNALEQVLRSLRAARSSLANTATLPPTFQN